MTNLKTIQGFNIFCGPAVLSALTGKTTDECANVIGHINGRFEIRGVQIDHLLKALDKLGFNSEEVRPPAGMLFGVLNHLSHTEGMYVVRVPKHVVAVEVLEGKIYLIDNHSKSAIDAAGSARLTQRVENVYKVVKKPAPIFLRTEILVERQGNRISVKSVDIFVNSKDNIEMHLGQFNFRNEHELYLIIDKLMRLKAE